MKNRDRLTLLSIIIGTLGIIFSSVILFDELLHFVYAGLLYVIFLMLMQSSSRYEEYLSRHKSKNEQLRHKTRFSKKNTPRLIFAGIIVGIAFGCLLFFVKKIIIAIVM